MSFTKATLVTAINNLAAKGKIFSNESQFQFDLAWELREMGYEVELEVLSVPLSYAKKLSWKNQENLEDMRKAYTDIVIKDGTDYIAIELKYKTPNTKDIMCYDVSGVKTYLFPQGAENIGSYLYWKDVERLESLVYGKLPLNFDNDKKVKKGYAILLTNAEKYWNKNARKNFEKNIAHEFFPCQGTKVYNNQGTKVYNELCYNIALDDSGKRIRGFKNAKSFKRIETPEDARDYYSKVKEAKEHYPIEIKGSYECKWDTYLDNLDCKLLNGNTEPKGDVFKYLILEINNSQGQCHELSRT